MHRGPSAGCVDAPGGALLELCWCFVMVCWPLLALCYGLLASAGALLWSAGALLWSAGLCWWSASLCCGPLLVTSHNTTIASSPLLCDMGNTATPCVTCVTEAPCVAHATHSPPQDPSVTHVTSMHKTLNTKKKKGGREAGTSA